MLNLFQLADQGVNLAPELRTWLKAQKGLIFTLFAIGADAVIQFLAMQGDISKISLTQLLFVFIGAIAATVGYTGDKYVTSYRQPPQAAIDVAATQAEKAFAPQGNTHPMPVVVPQAPLHDYTTMFNPQLSPSVIQPPMWMSTPPNMAAPQATTTQFVPPITMKIPVPPTVPAYNRADFSVTGEQPTVSP